ncbi:MAG: redoxin domain-containing protein [Mariniblastus sp.]|nr:redoxin domain-containing protein [Mariniblastus sp.]
MSKLCPECEELCDEAAPYCRLCGYFFDEPKKSSQPTLNQPMLNQPTLKQPKNKKLKRAIGASLGVLLLIIVFIFWPAPTEDPFDASQFQSFIGAAPPALDSELRWLSAAGETTLEDQKGNVIWLEFGNLANRFTPHRTSRLRDFAKAHSGQNLTVITVFNGPEDRQQNSNRQDLMRHVVQNGMDCFVLDDTDGDVSQAYGITRFPCVYLLDTSGEVVWEGNSNFAEGESEMNRLLGAGGSP